jgi:hypothetical protein
MMTILKRQLIKAVLLAVCLLSCGGVVAWRHGRPLPARGWIASNLESIDQQQTTPVHFAVLGDNRDSGAVFESILKDIARDEDVSFVVGLGDHVHDGDKEKYRYFLGQVREDLTIPFLTTVGNHEKRNGGRDLYGEVFGPLHYSFQIGPNYFIVLDNSSGLGEAQTEWLTGELLKAQDFDTRVVFMHEPFSDPAHGISGHCMSEDDSRKLLDVFQRYRVTHVFASHMHGYWAGERQGIPYTVTGGAGAVLRGGDPEHHFFHYLKVSVGNGRVDAQVKRVATPPSYDWFGRHGYATCLAVSAFLRLHGIEILLLFLAAILLLLIVRAHRRHQRLYRSTA